MSDADSSEHIGPSQLLESSLPGSVYTPQHILDIFDARQVPRSLTAASSQPPARHLCALNLSIRIQGLVVTDKLLWSVFLLDPYTSNPIADTLGYGGEGLSAYAAALLIEFGLEPTATSVAQVCASAMSQMDVVRCAVLVPDETETLERRGRGRLFDRMVKIDLPDINDYVFINAWTEDAEVRDLVNTLAAELSLKAAIKNNVEWLIFRSLVAHRQVFLDNFPHIQSGILRVVNAKRQEARMAAFNK